MQSVLNSVKTPVIVTVAILLTIFLFTKIFGPIPFSVNSVTTTKSDFFTVDGTGEAAGIPDTAQFTVGVTQTASTVEAAQNQVNQSVQKIVTAIKQLGVPEDDIKTSDYTINPNIDYTGGSQRTTGYNVSTNMTVMLEDASKANQALDAATANGANIINGVSFELNDKEKAKLEDQAREDAIKDAKEKAQKISSQAGLKLGKITNIYITPQTPGPIMYDKVALESSARGGSTPTELQTGENKVTVTVTLSYETL